VHTVTLAVAEKHPLKCFRYYQHCIFSTHGRFCWFHKFWSYTLFPPLFYDVLLIRAVSAILMIVMGLCRA